jgi:hypothetical protein
MRPFAEEMGYVGEHSYGMKNDEYTQNELDAYYANDMVLQK